MTDGVLFKESTTKIKALKGKYRKIFVAINFKKQLIRFKKNDQTDEVFLAAKDI